MQIVGVARKYVATYALVHISASCVMDTAVLAHVVNGENNWCFGIWLPVDCRKKMSLSLRQRAC